MAAGLEDLTKRVQGLVGAFQDGKWGLDTAGRVLTRLEGIPGAPEARHINSRGLDLVKHFEGCPLAAYQDEVGVWTIGWGHTGLQHRDGTVYEGRVITQEQADGLLAYDMHQFESRVSTLVEVALSDDQFSALTSFDFNTGALGISTLLRLLNQGDYNGAADQLPRWDKAGGVVLRGLTRRRASERNLFLGKTPFLVEG